VALDIDGILDPVVSHALASGYFERVNQVEATDPPGNGLTCAVWVNNIRPARSGLASTSVVLIFNVRLYTSMLQDPPDAIDPAMTKATSGLIGAYVGDFTLGDVVMSVDVRGMEGTPLGAQAGYIDFGTGPDRVTFRVMTITLPLIVSDVWDEVA
jgi:hypothetical protein